MRRSKPKTSGTGVEYSGATSTTGNYTIAQLPPGSYQISVTVPGFKKYSRSGLQVEVAQTLRVDISLEVGSATESVTVTESASLLRTESGELSHNVDVKRLDDLPILGIGGTLSGSAGIRNPMAMVTVIPGSTFVPNALVRINGTPANSQSFRIEGQDASNTGTPGVPAQTQPSVDAIQEVAIQTSNYAAEYGQVGGGMFNITMKSGANQFHGSAYDYFVNEVFNAGNPFVTGSPQGNPRARARRNDYGFTLGGPVDIPKVYDGHDKTFFFFNWEQFREATNINNQFQTIPALAYRTGELLASNPSERQGDRHGSPREPHARRDDLRSHHKHHRCERPGIPDPVPGQHHSPDALRSGGGENPGAVPAAQRAHPDCAHQQLPEHLRQQPESRKSPRSRSTRPSAAKGDFRSSGSAPRPPTPTAIRFLAGPMACRTPSPPLSARSKMLLSTG